MQEPIQPAAGKETRSPSPVPAFLCVAGGLLAALGSFLPWVKVSANLSQLGGGQFSETVNGLDGDGVITLIAGIALIAVGVVLMVRQGRWALGLGIVGILAGIIAAATSIYDILTIKTTTTGDLAEAASRTSGVPVEQARQVIDRFLNFDISPQVGIVLVAVGGLVGLVGGILALARRSTATTPAAPLVAGDSPMSVPPPPSAPMPATETPQAPPATQAPPPVEPASSAPVTDEDPPPTA